MLFLLGYQLNKAHCILFTLISKPVTLYCKYMGLILKRKKKKRKRKRKRVYGVGIGFFLNWLESKPTSIGQDSILQFYFLFLFFIFRGGFHIIVDKYTGLSLLSFYKLLESSICNWLQKGRERRAQYTLLVMESYFIFL